MRIYLRWPIVPLDDANPGNHSIYLFCDQSRQIERWMLFYCTVVGMMMAVVLSTQFSSFPNWITTDNNNSNNTNCEHDENLDVPLL